MEGTHESCSRSPNESRPAWGTDGPADERPNYSLAYTVHRTDLPGNSLNRATSRAFVVKADGSGTTELAPDLVTKPHQSTQFGGWSPDGRQAILYQMWDSPENGEWEDKHGRWRFSAAHWLQDLILVDMETLCRSLHDFGNFTVNAAGDIVGSVMLDVFALTELARPFPAGKLSCRVSVGEAVAVEGDLEETGFERSVNIAVFITELQE